MHSLPDVSSDWRLHDRVGDLVPISVRTSNAEHLRPELFLALESLVTVWVSALVVSDLALVLFALVDPQLAVELPVVKLMVEHSLLLSKVILHCRKLVTVDDDVLGAVVFGALPVLALEAVVGTGLGSDSLELLGNIFLNFFGGSSVCTALTLVLT